MNSQGAELSDEGLPGRRQTPTRLLHARSQTQSGLPCCTSDRDLISICAQTSIEPRVPRSRAHAACGTMRRGRDLRNFLLSSLLRSLNLKHSTKCCPNPSQCLLMPRSSLMFGSPAPAPPAAGVSLAPTASPPLPDEHFPLRGPLPAPSRR